MECDHRLCGVWQSRSMGATDDDLPQLGHVSVDPAALREPGETLVAVLASFGWREAIDLPAGAPVEGWRAVQRHDGTVVLAAPTDASMAAWFVGHVSTGQTPGRRASVHLDVLPLRPSRRERRAGLELRWPATSTTTPDLDALAIDVVNTGDERWSPNGDDFHVTGVVTPLGAEPGGVSFGFVAGRDPALALDPGEYQRVRVNISPDLWNGLRAGPHEVHAWLVTLGLRASTALRIDVAVETIERFQARLKPRRDAPPTGRAELEQRRGTLRALRSAGAHAAAVIDIVSDAPSDEAAAEGIAELLECSPEEAQAVLAMQLRRFGSLAMNRLTREADELDRMMTHRGDDPPPTE